MEKSEIVSEQSDNILYKNYLRGDNDSFNKLIIKYRKQLTYFIMTYVKNMDVAEDIAQDSFLYLIINKTEYDFKYSFKTYLYTIAKSKALNYLKKQKKVIFMKETNFDIRNFDIDIECDFIQKEDYKMLRESINQLKNGYQRVIYLYDFQRFKYKDICKILNQSMPKTKMLIHRARKSLKKIIKEESNYDV